MSRTAIKIPLNATERELLRKIHNKRSVPAFLKQRLHVVLAAATDLPNKQIATETGLEVHFIGTWRNRWARQYRQWNQTDEDLRPAMNERLVLLWLSDAQGRGRKERITMKQRSKIAALSQEPPEKSGLPVTHWTPKLLAKEAMRRGIVDAVSASTVRRILKKRLVAAPEPLLAQREHRRRRNIRA